MPLPTFQREGTILAGSFSGPSFDSLPSLQLPVGWETTYSKRARYPAAIPATSEGGMIRGTAPGGWTMLRPGAAVQLEPICEATAFNGNRRVDVLDPPAPGLSYRLEPLYTPSLEVQHSSNPPFASDAPEHASTSTGSTQIPLIPTEMSPLPDYCMADGRRALPATDMRHSDAEGALGSPTLGRACCLEPITFPSQNRVEVQIDPPLPPSRPSALTSDGIARTPRCNDEEAQDDRAQRTMKVHARTYRFVIEPDSQPTAKECAYVSNSPPPETRPISPLSELSYSSSNDNVSEVVPSVRNSNALAVSESMAISQAIDLVDWINHRQVRGYRKRAGQTVWYKYSGFAPLQTPPSSLCTTADPTDLFLYHDMSNSKLQVWILGDDRVWRTAEDGHVHPTDASRRLHIQPCRDPSWVTRATYNGYTYHQRKAASHGEVRK